MFHFAAWCNLHVYLICSAKRKKEQYKGFGLGECVDCSNGRNSRSGIFILEIDSHVSNLRESSDFSEKKDSHQRQSVSHTDSGSFSAAVPLPHSSLRTNLSAKRFSKKDISG